MKIVNYPSDLPEWYDPQAPGFVKPNSWKGTRVRISVPVSINPSQELAEARKKLQSLYPGADLHLVPEFTKISSTSQFSDLKGTDEDLLRSYFRTLSLPNHITVEQVLAYTTKFIPPISIFGSKGIKLMYVEAENVLCFEHIELELNLTGLTLVTGLNKDWNSRSNGSGKSSLISLAFIALFGRTFKDQTHDEWASQFNEKTAKLTLVLFLSDNRKMEIVRQRRPGMLRVFLDDKEITMGTVSATQNLIEHLTNLSWDVLTNALYIGQSEIGSVFGTEKDRKELFGRLLNLDRFLDAQTKLSKISLRIKRASESIDNDVEIVKAQIYECLNTMSHLRSELNTAPKISKKEMASLKSEMAKLKVKEDQLFDQLRIVKLDRETCAKEIQKWYDKQSKSETTIRLTQKTLDSSLKAKELCVVCGNQVDKKVLKSFQDELANTIELEKQNLKEYLREVNKISKEINSLKTQERVLTSDIEDLRTTQNTKLITLNTLKSHSAEQDRLSKRIQDYERRIKTLEKTKKIHELAKQSTLEEKQFVDVCVNAVSRNGLPAYLCETVVPQLNKTAQHYSEVFAEGEIGIQFSASNGDVDVKVCNLHGGKLTKDQSAGEMRMAAIITAFTFRDVLLQLNLLIIDEPSEGFDPANSLAFPNGLNQVLDRFEHIMVISHNMNLLSSLDPDRRIEVVKENGISVASVVIT